jgi:hypothetical protein
VEKFRFGLTVVQLSELPRPTSVQRFDRHVPYVIGGRPLLQLLL